MVRQERLQELETLLGRSQEILSGGELAERFGVSRQAIVQDMAILRSRGIPIRASAQGYTLDRARGARRMIAVRHGAGQIRDELSAIVSLGGQVLDVIVDHPVYGEIRGDIGVGTLDGVVRFVHLLEQSGGRPLSGLSGGFHMHTVEAVDEAALDRIEAALEALEILER